MTTKNATDCRAVWLSPLRVTLLVINAVCFGACLVLLAAGKGGGPVVLLTIGTGLMLFAGVTGALIACRRTRSRRASGTD